MNIPIYVAAPGSRYSHKDATLIGPELEQLAENGASTAADIVEAARSKRSPLHRYFEWNNGECGRLWREHQARVMVGAIQIRISESEEAKPVRAFYAIRLQDEDTPKPLKSYQTIRMVSDEEYKSRQIVQQAYTALIGWQNRYAAYRAMFTGVFEAIEQLEPVIELDREVA